jgi:hypothetical protein
MPHFYEGILQHIVSIIVIDEHAPDNAVKFFLIFLNNQIESEVLGTFFSKHD